MNAKEQREFVQATKVLKDYIEKEKSAIRLEYAQVAVLMDEGRELVTAAAAALIQLQNEILATIRAETDKEIAAIRSEREKAIAAIREAGNIEQDSLKQSALGALEIING